MPGLVAVLDCEDDGAKVGFAGNPFPIRANYPTARKGCRAAGVVRDWSAMEQAWYDMLQGHLGVDPEGTSVLLTESILTTFQQKKQTAEFFFETMGVSRLWCVNSAILALRYYSDKQEDCDTGLVVEGGATLTSVIPVVSGQILKHSVRHLPHERVDPPALSSAMEAAIWSSPIDCRRALYEHILLSGPSTMAVGYDTALHGALSGLVTSRAAAFTRQLGNPSAKVGYTVNVLAAEHRDDAAWLGGSLFAMGDEYSMLAVSRQSFMEVGAERFR
ncbi:Actin, putative [Angomonas deanei]|uniref:Actin, putative n=1 Tax=Angomonas deanei TaxID=59799 RepID=A0A7G2CQ69_9TRYP|nr:Actin, putative [Angomonas deanei]